MTTQFSLNLIADITEMWSFPFMVNAFRAATLVAVLAAGVGVLMVIRGQTFIGHSLSVIGLPGASGAVLLGLPAAAGYYAAAGIGVLVLRSRRSGTGLKYADETATVGTFQAMALATGLLFISLYNGFLGGTSSLLFGSILGVTTDQVVQLALISGAVLLALAVIWRPLLFTSLDPVVAASRGLRTPMLNLAFLVLLAASAAAVAQITGALLVFALLVLPAASAQLVTTRPARAVLVAIAFAVLTAWVALFAAFYTDYPVGFWISTIAFGLYVLLRASTTVLAQRPRHLRVHQ